MNTPVPKHSVTWRQTQMNLEIIRTGNPNAQAMARQLEQYGIEVLTGGTDSLILLIDLSDSKYPQTSPRFIRRNGIL